MVGKYERDGLPVCRLEEGVDTVQCSAVHASHGGERGRLVNRITVLPCLFGGEMEGYRP
jgi:hypothetical protein